jgi:3'-phosphoadenosine 5'-phosphosulfate sulfotransferase (PAPS reductase)/FAD synthetase
MNTREYVFKIRQNYPFEMKPHFSRLRIKQWYEFWGGMVYVSFSGGKDSTVVLDMVRSLYPEVPAVFVDTGLEYPEIRAFVKTIENVIWLRPKMTFKEVIERHGYPIISKEKARYIRDIRESTPTMKKLRLEGIKKDGTKAHSKSVLPKKWRYLVDSDFKISEKCCDVLKKEPFKRYAKESGRVGITGMMAAEGGGRSSLVSCNAFDAKEPTSSPLLFWNEADIWKYLETYNVPYSEIYDMGERRTGCMFCAFGAQLEEEPNRFQRMEKSHPKQHKYCMENLGMAHVLETVGVEWGTRQKEMSFI